MPPSPQLDDLQALLEFIYEFALDEKVFLLALTAGDRHIELRWHRHAAPDTWRLRFDGGAEEATVPRSSLLAELRARGVRQDLLRRELHAVMVAQVVHADMLLGDARRLLGRETVRRAVLDHRAFMGELERTVRIAQRQPLMAIEGGGERSEGRRGHLKVV